MGLKNKQKSKFVSMCIIPLAAERGGFIEDL
jgi:hypothetical protein